MEIQSITDPYALYQDGSRPLTADWDAGNYDIKALSFSIGDNKLTTTEWAYLDGLDQAVKTSDDVVFNSLKTTGNGLIWSDGTTGTTPASGAGTRFMWIPAKYAFRAGVAIGTEWDDANIGSVTFGFGASILLEGTGNYGFGNTLVTAPGSGNNFLAGYDLEVAENFNILFGDTIYSGNAYCFAYGNNIITGGDHTVTFGRDFTPLASDDSMSIGWGQLDYSFTATAANFYDSSITTANTITAEQLTSTDDITMQGHLLTMGNASQAVDTVLSFLGSTNSATLTYDESENMLVSTAPYFDLGSNGEVRGKVFVNSGDSTNKMAFQTNGIALIHQDVNGVYLQAGLKQKLLDINYTQDDLDFSINTPSLADFFYVDAGSVFIDIGSATNYARFSSTGVLSFGGSAGLQLPRFTDNVSNPPTDAELDAAIGAPSTVGEGYIAIVDDNDAGANIYIVVSTGTDADKWWIATLTQAA